MGWTWWGGGPWWGNYMFALDPTNLGGANQTDQAAMGVLQPYFATRVGDFNHDGHVNSADIAAMMMALTNLQGFESTYGFNDAQVQIIGDMNADGKFNNADLQRLITFIKAGGGSDVAVPEPESWLLIDLAGVAFLVSGIRKTSIKLALALRPPADRASRRLSRLRSSNLTARQQSRCI